MVFKNFRFQIFGRVIILAIFIFAIFWFFILQKSIFWGIFFSCLTVAQIFVIVFLAEKSKREIIDFLGFIRYDDFSVTFSTKQHSGLNKKMYEEYNKVIMKFRALRTDRETNSHFLKSILQHIDIGVFAYNKMGQIKIINISALRLLGMNQLKNTAELIDIHPHLHQTLHIAKPDAKTVIKILKSSEQVSVTISIVPLILQNEEISLVSIQSIQTELEEKEMEAWQNMIRVMTHEIMNSLTPIISLAATVSDEMSEWQKTSNFINPTETKDIFNAISTIKKRSQGLFHFVDDFRDLSQMPKPKLAFFALKPLVDSLQILFKNDLEKNNISWKSTILPQNMNVMADSNLIEQALINIIKNAIESFESNSFGNIIEINAQYNANSKVEILIQDNGKGIAEEILEKVFIPFYSTKKTGSGIGLTISKQIMRLHNGTVKISSVTEKGTLVRLIF